jgi:hypothetical protein
VETEKNQVTDPYHFRSLVVPTDMRLALDLYAENHHPFGDFLYAVLSNDLREATARADEYNLPNLGAFVAYCWNELPAACWGSPEKVAQWLRPQMQQQNTEQEEA